MSLGETPWVDKNLRGAWPRIAREVPESWLPRTKMTSKTSGSRHKKLVVEEFACGHYGCVMPTNAPGIVCKITSDPTEARFIAAYLKLSKPEGGLVRYEKIFELEGQEHKKRPLFVLWREEAFDVGFMRSLMWPMNPGDKYDEYELRSIRQGVKLLNEFLELAHMVRETLIRAFKSASAKSPEDREVAYYRLLDQVWNAFENSNQESDPRYYKGVPRAGIALRQCYGLAQEIANTYLVDQIGSVLGDYIDEGILLADVHTANIGKNADGQSIITDPGHAVAVHPKWVQWPEIKKI